MRCPVLLLAIALASTAPTALGAQAARVGRLPLLELPSPGVGTCRIGPASPTSRRLGVARTIQFSTTETEPHHLVSLSVDAQGAPVLLMALMGTKVGRRGESESITVSFISGDRVTQGKRSAFTTGTPSRMSDDRRLGLLPTDTADAQRMVKALRQRCRA